MLIAYADAKKLKYRIDTNHCTFENPRRNPKGDLRCKRDKVGYEKYCRSTWFTNTSNLRFFYKTTTPGKLHLMLLQAYPPADAAYPRSLQYHKRVNITKFKNKNISSCYLFAAQQAQNGVPLQVMEKYCSSRVTEEQHNFIVSMPSSFLACLSNR